MEQQTILTTDEMRMIDCVRSLIYANKIYQIDGKHDRYLVKEVEREMGYDVWSDSITREARKVRRNMKIRFIDAIEGK